MLTFLQEPKARDFITLAGEIMTCRDGDGPQARCHVALLRVGEAGENLGVLQEGVR
jgi:hypothetical protein